MSGTGTKSGHGMSSRLAAWLLPFSDCFTIPTWRHVLVLIAGAILSPGRRTAAAALRVVGLERRSKIGARGIYRDPVRSSHGHFVKTSRLRWLCVMCCCRTFLGLAASGACHS